MSIISPPCIHASQLLCFKVTVLHFTLFCYFDSYLYSVFTFSSLNEPKKRLETLVFFCLTTQELIQSRSVKPGSFSARTDGASRPCGDVMMMMIAQTAATRRTVVSSPESVTVAEKRNDAFACCPVDLLIYLPSCML